MQATTTKEFPTVKFNHLGTKTVIREQQILEPDDDLRRAITMDELRDKIVTHIHELYAKNESNSNTGSI
jgi:hypothetical protein